MSAASETRTSVALATFNGARYLREQVLSILGQTVTVDELIVSDDGSRDGSVRIVRDAVDEHGPGAPRLVVLDDAPAGGVTANFERAIAATTGDVVLLSDQDDRWHPDRVAASLAAFASRADLLLVHADAVLVDESGRTPLGGLLDALEVGPEVRERIHDGDAFDVLMQRNVATGATIAFRRPLFELARPFPASWLHDEWLAIVAASANRMDLIDRPVIDYRQHAGNVVGAHRLGLAQKADRLREPRAERNARLLARAEALSERITGWDTDPVRIEAARAKLAHERARSGLPATRVLRLGPALGEWSTGRYRRFGRGAADLVRDLVQPAGGRSAEGRLT
ncbi:MAG TPA: glycosyltransferase family 2 protein [Pseudolysinimonas sp.]|jgi:glycosyltransferase involved in cell wall biosynthesis|nr:glycosyltransferase family 2 protein [Pseudolysinimonas sp.]